MDRQYRLFAIIIAILAMCSFNAHAVNEDIFDTPELRDILSLKGRPIYFNDPDRIELDGTFESDYLPEGGVLEYHYLSNRLALTGESCAINKMISSIGVGSWNDNLGNLLNDNLDDYCEFNAVASVGLTVDPIVSVRDRSCYYAKGTEAGFCLVAGSGNSVLSLDIIKAMVIGFYRDGNLVGTQPVKEGQDGSGVTLSLIQIPGSDDACLYLTADAPGVFDEITLDFAGGVSVSAGQILRIKYAFVGRTSEFTITKSPINGSVVYNKDITTPFQKFDVKNANVDLDYVKAWNPVLLGLPFPVVDSELNKFINSDFDDYISLTPILAIGYQGGAKFMMKDTKQPNREVYEAGTEVGFKYTMGAALALKAGAWINLVLFDRNGNKVQEETVSAEVLNLSLAQGGSGSSSLISQVPFSGAELRFLTTLGLDVGGIFVHYAFVREKADIRHHCPINPSASTSLCEEQTSFQLHSNPAVSVSWTIVSQPQDGHASVTESGYVTNIDVAGEYVFRATASDGCYDEVTINSGGFGEFSEECGTPMVNDTSNGEYVAVTLVSGSQGGLIQIDKLENSDNVVTNDFKSYASYYGGLEVATNKPVLGVRRTDALMYDATTETTSPGKRMGFVVESAIEGLNLSALQFWQIRCYHDGKEVYRHVIDESNAVSADIGGSNKSQKMRYSIAVPPIDDNGQPMQVDEIVLWSSGVLALEGSEIRIYYAFIEEADSQCNDPLGCSAQLLSFNETHTTLDFDMMQSGSAIVVANAVNDLDNLVDDDQESYISLANTVSVGSGIPIAVKLGRTLDYRNQLGIIMDNKTFLAGVNAGSWLTIETYYCGVATGDKFTDWNAVDANVAGYGDKNILYLQPKYMYDEIKITIAKTVAALDVMKFYGIFVRGDIDNDGVPDCQDPESCSSNVRDITVSDVCVGDEILISATGIVGADYTVSFSEPNIDTKHVTADNEGNIEVSYVSATPGMYQMVFYDGSGKPLTAQSYAVHPLETTWLTTATNSDWNKWDNWSNGTPYCCTNVIIPSNAVNYPDLSGNVLNGDEYCCNSIHFEPHAEVNNVANLNYGKAWVDIELDANRYHLLSSPLKKMFTGDMFVPASMNGIHSGEYFTSLDAATSPENRFNPTIYQRLWYNSAENRQWNTESDQYKTLSELEEIDGINMTKWSQNFNHLAYEYMPGAGFSLWVDNGNLSADTPFRIRLPKMHTTYNYYSDFDQSKIDGISETLVRTEGDKDVTGRFIYEKQSDNNTSFVKTIAQSDGNDIRYDRTVYTGALPYTVNLSAQQNTEHFLFGNPFMSNINARKFITGNIDAISGIMVYDGNTTRTLLYDEASGSFVETTDISVIAPMQAVFVIAKNSANKLALTVTEDMLKSDKPATADSADGIEALRISAKNGDIQSSVMFVNQDATVVNEALLDNEVAPQLSILALDNGSVLDIIPLADNIPLTVIKQPEDVVTIEFHAFNGFRRDDYVLKDMATGETYSLDNDVTIPKGVSASAGRYVLVRKIVMSSIDNMKTDSSEGVFVETANSKIVVRSVGPKIAGVKIYDVAGMLIADREGDGSETLVVDTHPGIRIVSVATEDGLVKNYKLLVR